MEASLVDLNSYPPPASYLVKEEVLNKIMEFRTKTRQVLSRAQGEAAEAANSDHQRHLLIKQGDGRYLYMPAITKDQVKEALVDLPPNTKRLLGCEELRDQVTVMLKAEITRMDYTEYLEHDGEVETMAFEDQIDVCAHGRLAVRYARPAVPRSAVAGPAHASDTSSAPSNIFGDISLNSVLATPQASNDGLDREEEV
ncbi:hypothetical protein CONLIGDRAFT_167343 [Coniochaeta ligniaria NRRL 30616]|uniref:Uncharacterized protein n=1 Tax=Coniochaeta ligniaria NRRL 30616 TaxID=1408157 RepID=A0A1J7JV60_9PEZI|nr:hypothetical protein CONLIGDRAFT_167343 [Coniochaeta ligniaria NRRL 30616]